MSPKSKRPPFNRNCKRLRDLKRLFLHRHGPTLPNDEESRYYFRLLAHHQVRLHGNAREKLNRWAEVAAPWATSADIDAAVAKASAEMAAVGPVGWSDADLGERIGLTYIEREACAITTIAPCELTRAEFQERQREKRRKRNAARMREKRRKDGVRPRELYLATAREAQKPWFAMGISRATWYNRQKRAAKVVAPSKRRP